ncbi:MAG TPA: hypothetical protein VFO36_08725, partial [Nitrospiraceae bacterium]|nr:hypothetical protein [Nitrospiraceae bacterium]
ELFPPFFFRPDCLEFGFEPAELVDDPALHSGGSRDLYNLRGIHWQSHENMDLMLWEVLYQYGGHNTRKLDFWVMESPASGRN